MADYKVGNLQIVFNAVDETSKAFENLSKNLRAVRNAILNLGKIGASDMEAFGKVIDTVTAKFSPLLNDIKGAGTALADFNGILQKIGANKISTIVQAVQNLYRAGTAATDSVNNIADAVDNYERQLGKTSNSLALVATEQNRVNVEFENLNRLLAHNTYDKVLGSVGGLAKEWRNVYTTLSIFSKQADLLTGGMFSQEAINRLQLISQKYFQQKEIVEQTNRAFREMEETYRRSKLTAEELVVENYNVLIAEKKKSIEFLQAILAMGQAGANTQAYTEELKRLRQELSDLTATQGANDKVVKKSTGGWKKFIKSIGRIALYRTIRRALQLITQSITQSIQEFAKVDDNVNNTMSQITSSLQVIKLSFGTAFLPILEAITPIIQQIAQSFANFANTISQAMATGETYWAINSEAIQDYREQLEKTSGTLASFDKINSLNAKDDNSIFFEERKVDKENEAVTQIGITIKSVTNLMQGLWDIISTGWNSIIVPIFNATAPFINLAINGITQIISWVGKAISKLDELGVLRPLLLSIGSALALLYAPKVISGIATLISKFNVWYLAIAAVSVAIGILSNWDNFSAKTKSIITVVSMLITVFTGLAIAILAANGALTLGTGIALAVTTIAAGAVAIKGMISAAKKFKDGGVVPNGTLFYAGEAGAETVTVGSSGRTEVTNVSQMENALYNALVRYGRENRGSDQPIVVNIDGKPVFTSVRQVARSQGLDFARR